MSWIYFVSLEVFCLKNEGVKGRYSNLRPIFHKSFNSLKRTILV